MILGCILWFIWVAFVTKGPTFVVLGKYRTGNPRTLDGDDSSSWWERAMETIVGMYV